LNRIVGVWGGSIGEGDLPMEAWQCNTSLPMGRESHVKLMLQSKKKFIAGLRFSKELLPPNRTARDIPL